MGERIQMSRLIADYVPGTQLQPWTWGDEERHIRARVCACCDMPGHYQDQLEAHIAEHGMPPGGVCLSDEGVVWDGHHRIVAARRLGIAEIEVESAQDAAERWEREHGPVANPIQT